jgi:AraC-like DNA-binding protein
MVTSLVRTFDDPDDMSSALRPHQIQLTTTERGRFAGGVIAIELSRLRLWRGYDELARVARIVLPDDRAVFAFVPSLVSRLAVGGMEAERGLVLRQSLARDHYQTSFGPSTWANMSLPVPDLPAIAFVYGIDLSPPRDSQVMLPSARALGRLHRLHIAAAGLASGAPEILARPEAARGLELTLIEALAACLADAADAPSCASPRAHELIMRRFARLLIDRPAETLFMEDVSAAVGTSARTLRDCCNEHLGMGPKQFLMLRRMNLVHCALQRADSKNTTVTALATEFGFWELGRFAVAYRELYGEAPSATLLRPHGTAPPPLARDAKPLAHSGGGTSWLTRLWAAAVPAEPSELNLVVSRLVVGEW